MLYRTFLSFLLIFAFFPLYVEAQIVNRTINTGAGTSIEAYCFEQGYPEDSPLCLIARYNASTRKISIFNVATGRQLSTIAATMKDPTSGEVLVLGSMHLGSFTSSGAVELAFLEDASRGSQSNLIIYDVAPGRTPSLKLQQSNLPGNPDVFAFGHFSNLKNSPGTRVVTSVGNNRSTIVNIYDPMRRRYDVQGKRLTFNFVTSVHTKYFRLVEFIGGGNPEIMHMTGKITVDSQGGLKAERVIEEVPRAAVVTHTSQFLMPGAGWGTGSSQSPGYTGDYSSHSLCGYAYNLIQMSLDTSMKPLKHVKNNNEHSACFTNGSTNIHSAVAGRIRIKGGEGPEGASVSILGRVRNQDIRSQLGDIKIHSLDQFPTISQTVAFPEITWVEGLNFREILFFPVPGNTPAETRTNFGFDLLLNTRHNDDQPNLISRSTIGNIYRDGRGGYIGRVTAPEIKIKTWIENNGLVAMRGKTQMVYQPGDTAVNVMYYQTSRGHSQLESNLKRALQQRGNNPHSTKYAPH